MAKIRHQIYYVLVHFTPYITEVAGITALVLGVVGKNPLAASLGALGFFGGRIAGDGLRGHGGLEDNLLDKLDKYAESPTRERRE